MTELPPPRRGRHGGAVTWAFASLPHRCRIAGAANCRNKYVDTGSSLDPILRGRTTRHYQTVTDEAALATSPTWYMVHADEPAQSYSG